MIDMTKTVAPKSTQLNADDLLAGPRNITVTAVKMLSSDEQPVAIHFSGDDERPYLPCKSMRRVLIATWGPDGAKYVGRSMTIFCNRKVMWGGAEVGGIRISHVSHIEKRVTIVLTESKKVRKAYVVDPLAMPETTTEKPAEVDQEWVDDILAANNPLDLKATFGAAWKSGRNQAEKNAFKAAYDKRVAELTQKEAA